MKTRTLFTFWAEKNAENLMRVWVEPEGFEDLLFKPLLIDALVRINGIPDGSQPRGPFDEPLLSSGSSGLARRVPRRSGEGPPWPREPLGIGQQPPGSSGEHDRRNE